MNATHAAALHWQEAHYWQAMARQYPQRRRYYERQAESAARAH